MIEKYSNIYIGLVVNNQDPNGRGRVQVFIPHITNTLYKGWNDNKKDKKFRTLDSANFSLEIVQKLVDILPWSEVSMPFFGGGTGAPVSSAGVPTPVPTEQAQQNLGITGSFATPVFKPPFPQLDGLNNGAGLCNRAGLREDKKSSTSNNVNEQELYNTIYSQLKTKLGGAPIPKEIEQYGVNSNLEGLSLLMMKVANKESGFVSTKPGDKGRFSGTDINGNKLAGGSHGIFQLSTADSVAYAHLGFTGNGEKLKTWPDGSPSTGTIPTFTIQQLQDPYLNVDFTTSVFADQIKKGTISKLKEYGWLQDNDKAKLASYNKSFSPGDTILSSDYKPDNRILAKTTNSFQNVKNGTNTTGVPGGPIGISSIPQIGSKAYVMFLDGNPLQPIVIGCYKEPTNV
jgi:hypothetical protein